MSSFFEVEVRQRWGAPKIIVQSRTGLLMLMVTKHVEWVGGGFIAAASQDELIKFMTACGTQYRLRLE